MNRMTIRDILEHLIDEQRVSADSIVQVQNASLETPWERQSPWYVRTLIGVSAWIAAILFLVFLFGTDLLDSEEAAVLAGIIVLVATTITRWRVDQIFVNQLMLAFNLTGQALFLIGLAESLDAEEAAAVIMLGLEIVLVIVYRDTVLRFLATLFSYGAVVSLGYLYGIPNALHGLVVLTAFAVGVLWYYEAHFLTRKDAVIYQPVRSGVTVALLFLLIPSILEDIPVTSWWMSTLGLLLVLFIVEYRLLASYQITRSEQTWFLVILGTALFAVPVITTPGIIAAILVLVLGFQHGQRVLMGLALVFLVVFLIAFYYHLDVTLLIKSLILAASGTVLLVMRQVFLWQFGPSVKTSHVHP